MTMVIISHDEDSGGMMLVFFYNNCRSCGNGNHTAITDIL